jgi:Fur family ferric uptake transcriptional regulator
VTLSRLTEPLAVDDLDAALTALRAHGLRVSAARRLVLEALFAADGPVTAEQIADGLGGPLPRSDLTSVYRNLEAFEAIGLVRHVHLGHGPGLYALAGSSELEYLVCEACGRVRAVESAELDAVREALVDRFGFHARFSHLPIVGLCPACAVEGGDDDLRREETLHA